MPTLHTIKHNNLTAIINPVGAELSSLQRNGQEFLWQGDEQFWTGQAPILFPIVGALKNDHTLYKGKQYEMPRHGVARRRTFECIDQTSDSSVTMRLQADVESLTQYPWQFELQVHFTLSESGLTIRYDIINHDNHDMLFTIGSHPAFALTVDDSNSLSDYDIQFAKNETLQRFLLGSDGLLQNDAVAYPSPNNIIPLSDNIFDDDALVFRNINSDLIHLRCKQKTVLTVNTGGAPHIGIWAKPGAPFVCIEPWLGTSDFVDSDGQFEHKPDLLTLTPKNLYSHQIGIQVA